MAYSRYRRAGGRSTRSRRRPARSTRRPRRYAAKKRTYRKRPMTKRSILNVTSEKKRDTMLQLTNIQRTAPQDGPETYVTAPAIIRGGDSANFTMLWCATARDNETNVTGSPGNKFDASTRTASSCYMVGLKENVEIQVLDGLPWQWRRICFTAKAGSTLDGLLTVSAIQPAYTPVTQTSAGYQRVLNAIPDPTPFYGLIFQGGQNVDWSNPITAKLDNERITVKYDKTVSIASGNEEGVLRKYSRYHPMGHNLEYNDDEQGGTTLANQFSVTSKRGMGDYWICDIILPRVGSNNDNLMTFGTESTLYWHER